MVHTRRGQLSTPCAGRCCIDLDAAHALRTGGLAIRPGRVARLVPGTASCDCGNCDLDLFSESDDTGMTYLGKADSEDGSCPFSVFEIGFGVVAVFLSMIPTRQ